MSISTGKLKVLLAWVFAFALCFALVGCGDSGSSPASASGGNASASESAPVDPAEKFVGDWVVAAIETQGLTVVGSFSEAFGEVSSISLAVGSDGTGSLSMGEDTKAFTWELNGDDAIVLTAEDVDDPLNVVYANDALALDMDSDDMPGLLYFTEDGTYGQMKAITQADLSDFAAEADAIGAWKIAGASMYGMSLFGDEASLAAAGITSGDMSLTIEEGGTLQVFGDSASWSFADGSMIVDMTAQGLPALPIKKAGDYLVLDVTEFMGSETLFLFEK